MLNRDAWLKFSPLLDEAMDMEEQHRAEWLAQLECTRTCRPAQNG